MGANSFGRFFTLTTFGESRSAGVGAVIDGCPAGIPLCAEDIQKELNRRKPGSSGLFSTKRNEDDLCEILSGVFEGKTLGSPIAVLVRNKETSSKDYENLKDLLRPNHADYPARIKFKGFNDIRGGGHFSGRITLPLTFAGAIAIDILEEKGIKIFSHIKRILDIKDKSFLELKEIDLEKFEDLKENSLPFIENNLENKTKELLEKIKLSGNSVGGEIECACFNLPVGLGSPFFDSLESKISHLTFSVPAIKGISFGIGFDFVNILGSEANDLYYLDNNEIKTKTNNNGGILGGLSTGMPLVFSVVVKPTSSISLEQKTVNIKEMKEDILKINGRHDACIVPRVLPVIEAIMALAIFDEII